MRPTRLCHAFPVRSVVSTFVARRGLAIVVGTAVVSVLLRLWVAGHTYGTDDVRYWTQFAAGVREHGPIGIYGHHFEAQYNHPPLAGWLLLLLNQVKDLGVSFPFLIRVPACIADGVTGVLLFRIVESAGHRRGAVVAALLFLLSPLGIIISGFHGNTDPVFVMLALAALYQVQVRQRPMTGGLLLALSISVKIVPVVLLPLFLLRLAGGRRDLTRFAAGGAAVFVVLWLPALVLRPGPFVDDVIGYAGNGAIQWGLPLLAVIAGFDPTAHAWVIRASAYAGLAIAALGPVLVARRTPDRDLLRFGLALAAFLVLSPAFAMQYLVWPLAASYLLGLRYATVYNLAASAFALIVYSLWNDAWPWAWGEARSFLFPDYLLPVVLLTWVALLAVTLGGLGRLLEPGVEPADDVPPDARTEPSAVRPVW
jgi:predicted membrane-bound dolichyl-phosphate-mannose-protein mannosyltransferase